MPAIAEPPTIDPTPGPADITSFEQAKAAPVAAPATTSTSPVEDLSNRHGLPQSALDSLDTFAKSVAEPKAEPAKVEPAEPATPPAPPTEGDDDLEKQVQSFKTLKEVRAAHKEALKREREFKKQEAEWKARLTEHEAKLKDYNPDAIKATTAELEAARKRAAELDEQIKTLDYTKSGEFHDKYVKPLAKALEKAYADFEEMEIRSEDGSTRKATKEDFQAFLAMRDYRAGEVAEKTMGQWAARKVMNHVERVQELKAAQKEAVDNAGRMAVEAQQKRAAEEAEFTTRFQAKAKAALESVENEYPDLFKDRKDDIEGNKWLAKGREMISILEKQDIDEDTRLKTAAIVRHRASAFPRVLYDLSRVQEENAALKKKLASYEKSLPAEGQGGPPGGVPAAPTDPMERSLREIDKMATRV